MDETLNSTSGQLFQTIRVDGATAVHMPNQATTVDAAQLRHGGIPVLEAAAAAADPSPTSSRS